MSYNPEAQIFQNQVVINDTTNGGITSGGLVVKGGLSTQDTFVTGHVAINDVKITPNLNDIVNEIERTLSNSITEFTDITDFSFNNSVTNSFKAQVAVTVSGASSKYAIWEMFGVYKPNGWSMTSSFTGDITGVVFKITNDTINGRGKIQYTNSNASGTTTIKFRAITTQPPGSSPTGSTEIINNTSGPFVVDTLVFANTSSNITSSNITYISDVLTINGSDRIVGENANQFTNFSNGGAIASMGDMSVARNLIIGSKIGIAKTAPGFSLDVSGDINFTGTFYQNGSPYSGSSIWQTNANTLFYTTGNLGLGTTNPTVRLDVVGNIKSTNLNASSGITTGVLTASGITAGNINFTGDLYQNGSIYASSPWTTDQNSIYYNSVGFVGIGTTVPGKTLDVLGDIRASEGITGANISATAVTAGSFDAANSKFTNATIGSFISGAGTVGGHFVPSTSGSYDLGSATNRWKDLYLSGNTIDLGGETISLNTAGNFDFGSSKLIIGGETLVATNGSFQIGETITSTTIGSSFDTNVEFPYMQDSFSIYADIYYDGWTPSNYNYLLFTGSDFGSMTTNSSIINDKLYVASASTELDPHYYGAWRAFNSSNIDFWHSADPTYESSTGAYIGSISTTANGVVYSGEWLQIQYPDPITLTSFKITPRSENYQNRSPRSFVVLGSNDGSTWNLLHEETNYTSWSQTYIPSTFNTSSVTQSYSYYRLVTRIVGFADGDRNSVQINEWELNPSYSQKTYKIRVNGNIEEIYSYTSQNKNLLINLLDENDTLVQTIYTSPTISFPEYDFSYIFSFDTNDIEISPLPGYKLQFFMDGNDLDSMSGKFNGTISIKKVTTTTVQPNNIMSVTNVSATNSTINSIVASTVSSGTLYLSSNAVIAGNLTISGTSVSSNSSSVNIKDNIIILNNQPDGLYDAGVMMQITQGNYASMYYDNATEDFNFIRTSSSAGTTITPENWVGLRIDHLHVLDTTNATGLGTGGSLNVQGGASIMKDVYVGGNFAATGSVTSSSDVRLKENIETISSALDKIEECRGVKYTKKATGQTEIGFIAQEVEEMFPEVVITDSSELKSVAYGNVTAVLVECIKDLKKQIEELKKKKSN